MDGVKVYAMAEGQIAFPRVPLLRIEGPLATVQLLETTLLCLVNYPSLMATNAARFRLAAGPTKTLLEFGLRRSQVLGSSVAAAAERLCRVLTVVCLLQDMHTLVGLMQQAMCWLGSCSVSPLRGESII